VTATVKGMSEGESAMTSTKDAEHKPHLHWNHVTTATEFEGLCDEWTDLFISSGSNNVFLTYEWMSEWWSQFGGKSELFVITVRNSEGAVIGLAPLCIERTMFGGFGPRVLQFLGCRFVGSDQLDVLAQPGLEEAVADQVVSAILGRQRDWSYIRFDDLAVNGVVIGHIREKLTLAGMSEIKINSTICPFTTLPASVEEYQAGLAQRVRHTFRNRTSALDRQGATEYKCLLEGPELVHGYSELMRLHQERFRSEGKTSMFLGAAIQKFHAAVLSRLAKRHWVRLYLVQTGGTAVAALYGFVTGNRFQFYQSGMDPAWSKFSVGTVIMGKTINDAINSGCREFDFLRGNETYKSHWAKEAREQISVALFNHRFQSRAVLAGLALRRKASRLKSRFTRKRAG
jgi:CelD/BcsL family acetyltransferase involved in cellulose biosynthesis